MSASLIAALRRAQQIASTTAASTCAFVASDAKVDLHVTFEDPRSDGAIIGAAFAAR